LTTAQAVVRYLAAQKVVTEGRAGGWAEGREVPFFAGVWAIFGHGD